MSDDIFPIVESDPFALDDPALAYDALPSNAEIGSVAELARELKAAEADVIEKTNALRASVARYHRVAEVELPEALRRLGVDGFPLAGGGGQVKLVSRLDGRKLTSVEGLEYVEALGASSLIRTAIEVELDRGDEDLAVELYATLRAHRGANRFKKIAMTREIPAPTVAKLARELIEAGRDPDLRKLGVHRRSYAVVGSRPPSVEIKGFKGE